ncbi:MAG TPA: AlkA N-terminal domain-containing protein [Kofleriaceae bacterium]|nr:AlkA N-terminal domain-containing protein [Kofleriaceae bacterium]
MDSDGYLAAMRARDARFDGVFYVGVTTTGVYCRPICPARTPGADRCRFYTSAALAERDGFRACLRCRPELAPGNAPVDSVPALARAAARRIDAGYLNDHSVEQLADRLGVTDRHLRRALETQLGASPLELAQTRRLALAKQLLHDSRLGLAEIAFAAGFASVRRFNDAFRERFGRPPSALRKDVPSTAEPGDAIVLRLDTRPPFDWPRVLAFLAARAIPGVEQVDATTYRRSVVLDGLSGWLEARLVPVRAAAVQLRVAASLAPKLMAVLARVRALFDLDAHPAAIAERLAADKRLAPSVKAHPGLRVPGAFDGWELALRAILGQQIAVSAATTLAGRLVARFGDANPGGLPGLDRVVPSPARVVEAGATEVATIGLPAQRARTIVALAEAVQAGTIDLSIGGDPEPTIAALCALPGIGPWTASYIAMRALAWPDAFLGGDLIVRRALDVTTARAAEERAERWRPWRAYAVLHLWTGASP